MRDIRSIGPISPAPLLEQSLGEIVDAIADGEQWSGQPERRQQRLPDDVNHGIRRHW